jgi:hypothetical protein
LPSWHAKYSDGSLYTGLFKIWFSTDVIDARKDVISEPLCSTSRTQTRAESAPGTKT